MRLINLTPHEIRILSPDGELVLQPSGQVARCAEVRTQTGWVMADLEDGMTSLRVPVNVVQLGELSGLPDPQPGVGYIVSLLAGKAAAAQGRDDVFVVDELVRDARGMVIGCRALARP